MNNPLNTNFLFGKVNSSALGFFRIAIGLVFIELLSSLEGYFLIDLQASKFFFTYDGFHWVQPMSPFLMAILFKVLYVAAGLFTLGIFYRFNALLLFVGWTYLFLICRGHYNNHYYLYSILLGFFLLTDGWKWGSVHTFFNPNIERTVPRWQLLIFKLQLLIVYFYGGLAKLEGDWLQGFPMRFWLYDRADQFPGMLADFFRTEPAAMIYSYGGVAFDLSIGFLLLNRRTRHLALIPIVFFHVSNHFFWDIGSFPWTMLGATVFFMEADFMDRVVSFFSKPIANCAQFFREKPVKRILNFFSPFREKRRAPSLSGTYDLSMIKRQALLGFLGVFICFQLVFPFRRHLFDGYTSWTGQGHLFSWRMMLMDTVDAIKMEVVIPETKEKIPIAFEQYINFQQFVRSQRTPTSMLRFAHFIRDEVRTKGGVPNPGIKLQMYKSVNERIPKLLNDTTLNYAMVDYRPLSGADWFQEWDPKEEKLSFNLNKYKHWKEMLDKLSSEKK